MVCLVCLIKQDRLDELNKPDEPERPERPDRWGLVQTVGPLDFRQVGIAVPHPDKAQRDLGPNPLITLLY